MTFEENIKFDPGFGKYLNNFYVNIEYVYETLGKIKTFNQKKFQFQKFYQTILKDIHKYINFYIGCMLWALFIKQFENKEIIENPAFNQEWTDEDGLFPVRYLQEYLPKFEKDVKYFLNKDIKFEEDFFIILDTYTKFLQLNKHFTKTKTSSDIKLPFEAQNPNYKSILKTIEKVTETGNFEELYEYRNLVLNRTI